MSTLVLSGGVPVSDVAPFSVIARIPREADERNGQLSILNAHGTATMYFRWIPDSQTNQLFETTDAGVRLTAGQSYSWPQVPAGKILVGRSSVADAICTVDGVIVLNPPTLFGKY